MSSVKIEGLRELEKALFEIDRHATRRTVARRVLKKAAQPLADLMKSLAPRAPNSGRMAESIIVSSRLAGGTAAKQAFARVMRGGGTRQDAVAALRDVQRASASLVEMHVGPGQHPQAIQQEFGNRRHAPQPFARPAWERDQSAMLARISNDLRVEIGKAVARARARAGV